MSQPQTSRLLHIVPEIRQLIYLWTFRNCGVDLVVYGGVAINTSGDGKVMRYRGKLDDYSRVGSILKTCRQCRQEAGSLYLSLVMLKLPTSWHQIREPSALWQNLTRFQNLLLPINWLSTHELRKSNIENLLAAYKEASSLILDASFQCVDVGIDSLGEDDPDGSLRDNLQLLWDNALLKWFLSTSAFKVAKQLPDRVHMYVKIRLQMPPSHDMPSVHLGDAIFNAKTEVMTCYLSDKCIRMKRPRPEAI